MFPNIIKILVSDLRSSQRIRRPTSLPMEMCVRSRVIIPSQNHVNRQEAVRARSSQSPSQRSQMPRAARARISQCQQFEFSVFLLITSKRAKESFVQFLKDLRTRVFTVQFDYLHSEVKESLYQFSRGPTAYPKANTKAAVLLFSLFKSSAVIIYLKVIMDKLKEEEILRRCQLSGGVRICN